jgi:hypothetical protein
MPDLSQAEKDDAIRWLLTLPPAQRRPWWRRHYRGGRLLDLAPVDGDPYGIMRWPDGTIWVPLPQPSWLDRLLRRARRTDHRADARLAASQIRALALQVDHLQHQLRRQPY